MKDIINTIRKSKRLLYITLLSLIVVFCIVLNYTFSAFTQSTVRGVANITVNELSYSTSVNGVNTNIISAPGDTITRTTLILESENSYDTKYEITYEVCSDSACNTIINEHYYLYRNIGSNWWWTMTPAGYFGGSTSNIRAQMLEATDFDYIFTSSGNGPVRPMIALKNTTTISGGEGTQANPFVVN